MTPKFKLNDKVFTCAGNRVIKLNVEESFVHQKQDEVVIKYACRPFGLDVKECMTLEEDTMFEDYEEAKILVNALIQESHDNNVYINNKYTEEYIDNMEKEYQEKLNKKEEETK